tara:strand:+ start:42 stop:1067 length:1026 start_codon:yes stop_codon:yes gene_type:complete
MTKTLVQRAINAGGKLSPLIIDKNSTGGLGLCNPSIYNDDGNILGNVRNVSYTLHHCEGDMKFQTPWGPLNYVRPDNDATLRTKNYLTYMDEDRIEKSFLIETGEQDIKPIWEFVGLEDARLVRWDGKLFVCGCRRDVASNGESRMEMSEIKIEGNSVREISRLRLPSPAPDSYCEKNWMPVLDMPYHFVKWTSPTEVVKIDPTPVKKYNDELKTNLTWAKSVSVVYHGGDDVIEKVEPRGGSQVITIGDYRIAITHECEFWWSEKDDRDAEYTHRFIVWDMDWKVHAVSPPWKFMNGKIEFCCGMAKDGKDILITFGYQDNSAFLLRLPLTEVQKVIGGQ